MRIIASSVMVTLLYREVIASGLQANALLIAKKTLL